MRIGENKLIWNAGTQESDRMRGQTRIVNSFSSVPEFQIQYFPRKFT